MTMKGAITPEVAVEDVLAALEGLLPAMIMLRAGGQMDHVPPRPVAQYAAGCGSE